MPQKDKLTQDQRNEIFEWKSKKGDPLPSDPSKKVSSYTIAPMYNVSHTMVCNIWKNGPERKSTNPNSTILARKLVELFGEASGDISDELKENFLANLSEKDKELIRRLRS